MKECEQTGANPRATNLGVGTLCGAPLIRQSFLMLIVMAANERGAL
jgi:hypothetical protein